MKNKKLFGGSILAASAVALTLVVGIGKLTPAKQVEQKEAPTKGVSVLKEVEAEEKGKLNRGQDLSVALRSADNSTTSASTTSKTEATTKTKPTPTPEATTSKTEAKQTSEASKASSEAKQIESTTKETTIKETVKLKSVKEIAKDVLNGKYGNGAQRKANLEKAGYNYNEVQAEVEKLVEANRPKPTQAQQQAQQSVPQAPSNAPYGTSVAEAKRAFNDICNELGLSQYDRDGWASIIQRESGWQTTIWNTTGSNAYGLPQAMVYLHGLDNSEFMYNPYVQLRWMYNYMVQSYGSITGAVNFWNANHWY